MAVSFCLRTLNTKGGTCFQSRKVLVTIPVLNTFNKTTRHIMGLFNPLSIIRDWLRIAKENPLFWYNILLIQGTVLIAIVFPGPVIDHTPSDFRIRAWGMALQLVGALTVWRDLTESAGSLGRPSFRHNTMAWMKRLAFGRPVVIGSACLPIVINVVGRGTTGRRDTPPSGAPIEERVAVLEYNLGQLEGDVDRESQRITTLDIGLQERIQEETSAREIGDSQLKMTLHDTVIGNYASLVFGAVWVVFGIVISALAPEIAKIVAGQWPQVWAAI